jgi:hypothetical protein
LRVEKRGSWEGIGTAAEFNRLLTDLHEPAYIGAAR